MLYRFFRLLNLKQLCDHLLHKEFPTWPMNDSYLTYIYTAQDHEYQCLRERSSLLVTYELNYSRVRLFPVMKNLFKYGYICRYLKVMYILESDVNFMKQ